EAPLADLPELALAALGSIIPNAIPDTGWTADMLTACVTALRRKPSISDRTLVGVADALHLDDAELMTIALCIATEQDARAARALAAAQAPIGGSRPLVGFAAAALEPLGASPLLLGCGVAVSAGCLRLGDEAAALPERSLLVPHPILAALSG